MSLPQRGRLIRLARQYDVLIITDDVYDLLHWPSQQSGSEGKARLMPRMVDVDRSLEGTNEFGNAVSNGSF
ncbi:aminotransferase, partial [Seiridium cupressi]